MAVLETVLRGRLLAYVGGTRLGSGKGEAGPAVDAPSVVTGVGFAWGLVRIARMGAADANANDFPGEGWLTGPGLGKNSHVAGALDLTEGETVAGVRFGEWPEVLGWVALHCGRRILGVLRGEGCHYGGRAFLYALLGFLHVFDFVQDHCLHAVFDVRCPEGLQALGFDEGVDLFV